MPAISQQPQIVSVSAGVNIRSRDAYGLANEGAGIIEQRNINSTLQVRDSASDALVNADRSISVRNDFEQLVSLMAGFQGAPVVSRQ